MRRADTKWILDVKTIKCRSTLHSFTYSTHENQNIVCLRIGVRLRVHVERSLDINRLSAPSITRQLQYSTIITNPTQPTAYVLWWCLLSQYDINFPLTAHASAKSWEYLICFAKGRSKCV